MALSLRRYPQSVKRLGWRPKGLPWAKSNGSGWASHNKAGCYTLTARLPGVNIIPVIPAEAGNACWYDDVGDRQGVTVTEAGGTKVHAYA